MRGEIAVNKSSSSIKRDAFKYLTYSCYWIAIPSQVQVWIHLAGSQRFAILSIFWRPRHCSHWSGHWSRETLYQAWFYLHHPTSYWLRCHKSGLWPCLPAILLAKAWESHLLHRKTALSNFYINSCKRILFTWKPHAPVWAVWVGNEIDFVERYYLAGIAVRHRPKPGHLAVFFSSIVFKY
jgi:hypothetical protein